MKHSIWLMLCQVLLTACGCADPEVYVNRAVINPAFLDIYLEYKADLVYYDYSTTPNHLNIMYTDEFRQLGKVGECAITDEHLSNNQEMYATIRILRKYYNSQGPYTKRALLYHELTHCIFYIGHFGKTGNIMAPDIASNEKYWENHWVEQVDTLFNRVVRENAQ